MVKGWVAFFSGLGERHKQRSANHAGVAEGRQTAWRRFQALMSKLSWSVLGGEGRAFAGLRVNLGISDRTDVETPIGCRTKSELLLGKKVPEAPPVAASFRRRGLPPTRM